MAGSVKKVILRTLADAVHPGYLSAGGFVRDMNGRSEVPLLDLESRIVPFALPGVRFIAYVRDFNLADAVDPERLSRRTFLARPRAEGLWLRLTFTDGDVLEGLAPLDLALADGLLEDRGIFVIPPDIRSNTQRLYIPRLALAGLEVVAVVTTPSKPRPTAQPQPEPKTQESLFPDPAPAPPARRQP